MTIALWCILAAALLPYAFTIAAKTGPRFTNKRPRDYLAALDGWRQRAHWVQLNSFEGLPLFIGAVLTCHLVGGDQGNADAAALTYIAARVLYGFAYVTDRHLVRSLMWFIAMLANVALFVIAAQAPAA